MISPKAFEAWEGDTETLEHVEARIHDGFPLSRLRERGAIYAKKILELFPWYTIASRGPPVEVGPGVGYIMEAFAEQMRVGRMIGLDVASGMIRHAKARLLRDGLSSERFQFQAYDGRRFPWPDGEIGAFYSVAAMQHVPKPFAYNMLFEMARCLAPGGCAAVHLLSWAHLAHTVVPIQEEIKNQIDDGSGHWHHYWDEIEIAALLVHGVKPQHFEIKTDGEAIWAAWRK